MPIGRSLRVCATWMGLWALVLTCQAVDPLVTVGKPALRDVEYSPDGRWLVVATDIDVRLLDLDDYEAQAVIPAGADQIAVSPDGTVALSRRDESVIELWDPSGPSRLLTLDARGHFAFCSDGRYLAYASDNTVRLYDLATGEIVRRYFGTRCSASLPTDRSSRPRTKAASRSGTRTRGLGSRESCCRALPSSSGSAATANG